MNSSFQNPTRLLRGNAPCQVQLAVWYAEPKGWDNIDNNRHEQSLSSQFMIDTIEEGAAHVKMVRHGMEREASAGLLREGLSRPDARRVQGIDSLEASVEQCFYLFYNQMQGAAPFGREIDLKVDERRGRATLSVILNN